MQSHSQTALNVMVGKPEIRNPEGRKVGNERGKKETKKEIRAPGKAGQEVLQEWKEEKRMSRGKETSPLKKQKSQWRKGKNKNRQKT